MQNLNNLNNLNALGIKGGALFNPSSIQVGGVKLLKQQLLTKQAPTLGGIVYDERTNKGTPRPIQLGRCYLMDGTDDYVDYGTSGFEFLDNASNAWEAEFYFNPSNLVGVRRVFTKQTASAFRGTGIYTNGSSLRFDLLRTIGGDQLTVSVNGFTPVVGTDYKVKMMYNGNKLATGVTWIINGVAYTSTVSTQTLTSDDVTAATSFKIGTDGSFTNYGAGKIWGLKLWDNTGTLRFFAKCDEQGGLSSLDSSGYGLHGLITNATLGTFHSTQNVISYQNDIGYSDQKNYWKYTQEFNASNWTKNGGSITATTVTDPLGGSFADTFTEDTSTGNHRLFQSSTFVTGLTYTLSVYLKYRNRQYVGVNNAANGAVIICDLQNGTISGSNGTIVSSGVVNVGGGWYRYYITVVSTTTGGSSSIIYGSTTGTGIGTLSYTGSGTDAFDIFGTQIEVGTLTQYQRNLLLDAGNKVPRNEAIPTQCVLGCPLQYSGEVPYDGDLENASCTVVNGTNQYWNIPDNSAFDISNNLSVTIRGKNANATNTWAEHIASKWTETGNQREWALAISLSQRPYVAFSGTGASVAVYTATNAITINSETTIGFTFASGTVKLYVNGVLVPGSVTTGSLPSTIYNGTSPIALGTVITAGSVNWTGSIWDTRVFKDTVLTDAEMLAIHTGTETTLGATKVAHYPMAEVAGNIIYDAIGTNHGTGVNAPTRGTQNSYFYNGAVGFSRYDHASLADILVPYSSAGTPLSITPPSGYTKLTDNPAGPYHNGAESTIDFTGNVLSPQAVINSWETAWAFNSARTNPEFKRTLTSGGTDYRADRFLAYSETLSGSNLSKVNKYVTTKAI